MATEEKALATTTTDVPAKKEKKKKAKGSGKVAKWFRELRSELKKVVWPTRKSVVNNTLVALFIMAVSAIVIWGFDTLADKAVQVLTALCR